VAADCPRDVQAVRVLEALAVAVRRQQGDHHQVFGGDLDVPDEHRLGGDARGCEAHRAVEAQELLDSVRH
jgi:hypothetical protein